MKPNSGPILAIDLGSTSFKAAVFGESIRPLGAGAGRLEYLYGPRGEVELDPQVVEGALRRAIREALRAAGVPGRALRAVALTSQAQTFTIAEPDGTPRRPFVSWQDARAGATRDRMRASPHFRDFAHHASFGDLLPALQICLLAHLQTNGPGVLCRHDRVLLLPAWVALRLTGRAVVDDNLAAMSGMYSLPLRGWWPVALDQTGVAREQLPDVFPVGAIAARTSAGACRYGIPDGIPLVLAGNDQTAGAYAAQVERQHALLITLGTAQVAYTACRRMPGSTASTIRGPYPGGRAYRMAADHCGGNLVNWAKTVIAGCGTDETFFATAAKAHPGCGGLVFEAGETASDFCWRGIGLHHTAADFARSILETLTRRMVGLVDSVAPHRESLRILAAGGGSRRSLWIGMLSAALGTKIRVIAPDPLAGAARMARSALASSSHTPRGTKRP